MCPHRNCSYVLHTSDGTAVHLHYASKTRATAVMFIYSLYVRTRWYFNIFTRDNRHNNNTVNMCMRTATKCVHVQYNRFVKTLRLNRLQSILHIKIKLVYIHKKYYLATKMLCMYIYMYINKYRVGVPRRRLPVAVVPHGPVVKSSNSCRKNIIIKTIGGLLFFLKNFTACSGEQYKMEHS